MIGLELRPDAVIGVRLSDKVRRANELPEIAAHHRVPVASETWLDPERIEQAIQRCIKALGTGKGAKATRPSVGGVALPWIRMGLVPLEEGAEVPEGIRVDADLALYRQRLDARRICYAAMEAALARTLTDAVPEEAMLVPTPLAHLRSLALLGVLDSMKAQLGDHAWGTLWVREVGPDEPLMTFLSVWDGAELRLCHDGETADTCRTLALAQSQPDAAEPVGLWLTSADDLDERASEASLLRQVAQLTQVLPVDNLASQLKIDPELLVAYGAALSEEGQAFPLFMNLALARRPLAEPGSPNGQQQPAQQSTPPAAEGPPELVSPIADNPKTTPPVNRRAAVGKLLQGVIAAALAMPLLAALGLWGYTWYVASHELPPVLTREVEWRQRLSNSQQQLSGMRKQADDARLAVAETLEGARSHNAGYLALLEALHWMPEGVWLTSIEADESHVDIQGRALSETVSAGLVSLRQNLTTLEGVTQAKLTQKPAAKGEEGISFQLALRLDVSRIQQGGVR